MASPQSCKIIMIISTSKNISHLFILKVVHMFYIEIPDICVLFCALCSIENRPRYFLMNLKARANNLATWNTYHIFEELYKKLPWGRPFRVGIANSTQGDPRDIRLLTDTLTHRATGPNTAWPHLENHFKIILCIRIVVFLVQFQYISM